MITLSEKCGCFDPGQHDRYRALLMGLFEHIWKRFEDCLYRKIVRS